MIEAKNPCPARFPGDFIFGVATASFQIEGATKTDGRKPSIWDAFSNMPGRVFGRHNGDIACDHYNRLEQDLDLIKSLGVEAYRFSIAWPRIIPDGTGPINETGLDFYDRLVDGCKARDIKTFATLYHWDLPLALMGDGGWTARSTAYAFQRYAKTVMARLGDRLDAVATFNEPWCIVWLSHLYGIHAPGERNMQAALHALHFTRTSPMASASRRSARKRAEPAGRHRHQCHVGLSRHRQRRPTRPPASAPSISTTASSSVRSSRANIRRSSSRRSATACPSIEDGDMEIISQKLDWWGLNYYTPMRVSR